MCVVTHVCARARAYVCTWVCSHGLVSFQVPLQVKALQSRISASRGVRAPRTGPWLTHSFTDPTFTYLVPYACPRGHNDEPETASPCPGGTKNPAGEDRQVTRKIQVSVKSAVMGTFRTLRECKGASWSSFRNTDGFLEGPDTYKASRGEPRESGSMFQAEGSSGAKRGCGTSGNLTGKEARALWGGAGSF